MKKRDLVNALWQFSDDDEVVSIQRGERSYGTEDFIPIESIGVRTLIKTRYGRYDDNYRALKPDERKVNVIVVDG